jgi:hypothetical protein
VRRRVFIHNLYAHAGVVPVQVIGTKVLRA